MKTKGNVDWKCLFAKHFENVSFVCDSEAILGEGATVAPRISCASRTARPTSALLVVATSAYLALAPLRETRLGSKRMMHGV